MKNIKKLALTIAVIMVATAVIFAQKADVSKDGKRILSDNTPIALVDKEGCGMLSLECVYYVNSLDSELLITIAEQEFLDPTQATSANPDGKVRFLRFAFMGYNETAEIRNPSMMKAKPKDVAKSIVKARLIVNGKLDEKAVRQFINLNGNRFTDRLKELRQPQQQIFIIEKP